MSITLELFQHSLALFLIDEWLSTGFDPIRSHRAGQHTLSENVTMVFAQTVDFTYIEQQREDE